MVVRESRFILNYPKSGTSCIVTEVRCKYLAICPERPCRITVFIHGSISDVSKLSPATDDPQSIEERDILYLKGDRQNHGWTYKGMRVFKGRYYIKNACDYQEANTA